MSDAVSPLAPARRGDLSAVFAPRSIAVLGATERTGSVGRALFERLTTRGFAGSVIPVTQTHPSVFGRTAYRSIGEVPGVVDLAVIAIPAAGVPAAARACAKAGVKAAIVISAGFREIGPAGAALESELRATARSTGMRIVGPNCLGVIVPAIGLDATFAAAGALEGSIGFVSQSGALCTAILDWSASRRVGFSCFVSAGSMVDAGWADYLEYLASDPRTASILLYMESVGDDASGLVRALRSTAALKPVIVMKSGRSQAGARAAASHTGALLGSDAVFDAVLRRCGALRVDSIQDLFDMADVLARGNRPKGKRLAIVTNAGGPGVIAADALVAGGGALARLGDDTIAALDRALPAHWSKGNPVDVFGDADAGRYALALDAVLPDPEVDAVLVVYAPQAIVSAEEVADRVALSVAQQRKPVLAAFIGGDRVAPGISRLEVAGIPAYGYPELAVCAFNYLWRYDENRRALAEVATPAAVSYDADGAHVIIAAARAAGREWLGPEECAALARAYGLPLIGSLRASDREGAVARARSIGYPVAIKLDSRTIVHKTEAGGVFLDIEDDEQAARAFDRIRAAALARAGPNAFEGVVVQPMIDVKAGIELILGSAPDPQFGPVIAFGLGGVLVEVLHDRALGLPPLTAALAHRLIEQTRAYEALGPIRGRRPVDRDALVGIVQRFSHLVANERAIREIELNPLYADSQRILALDIRCSLHAPGSKPIQPVLAPT